MLPWDAFGPTLFTAGVSVLTPGGILICDPHLWNAMQNELEKCCDRSKHDWDRTAGDIASAWRHIDDILNKKNMDDQALALSYKFERELARLLQCDRSDDAVVVLAHSYIGKVHDALAKIILLVASNLSYYDPEMEEFAQKFAEGMICHIGNSVDRAIGLLEVAQNSPICSETHDREVDFVWDMVYEANRLVYN